MSYNSRETSVSSGQPFELYLFQTQTQSWRFTSADEAQSYQGAAYSPESISRTNTSQNAEVSGGHIKVTIPKDHTIAQMFVAYIPSTPLTLVIYRGHRGEADSEMKVAFTGRVLLGRLTTQMRIGLRARYRSAETAHCHGLLPAALQSRAL